MTAAALPHAFEVAESESVVGEQAELAVVAYRLFILVEAIVHAMADC